MVASLPETRGKGLGHAMIRHTLSMIEARGVPYTHLTTDDYRLAAIKTYLDAGFLPVIYEDPESDMTERWNKVLEDLHYPMVEYLSE
jgi:mycothiol synthase